MFCLLDLSEACHLLRHKSDGSQSQGLPVRRADAESTHKEAFFSETFRPKRCAFPSSLFCFSPTFFSSRRSKTDQSEALRDVLDLALLLLEDDLLLLVLGRVE